MYYTLGTLLVSQSLQRSQERERERERFLPSGLCLGCLMTFKRYVKLPDNWVLIIAFLNTAFIYIQIEQKIGLVGV